ncbi:hypothetical protein D3C85_1619280 [compost metagenome]
MHKKNEWGPQPETVKDFRVIAYVANSLEDPVAVMEFQDNYQRQVSSLVQLENVWKLRVEVQSTNGLDHARIFEIRCC